MGIVSIVGIVLAVLGSTVGTQSQEGMQYYISNIPATWQEALDGCPKFTDHGVLATIGSKEENDQIANLIGTSARLGENFWTSGAFNADAGQWIWFSYGEPFTYLNWVDGQEPNSPPANAKVAFITRHAASNGFVMRPDPEERNYYICQVI